MTQNKHIRITWTDAGLYSPQRKIVRLPRMETTGTLCKELAEGFVVQDPKTLNLDTHEQHPKGNPTFYFIPKGMVTSVGYDE